MWPDEPLPVDRPQPDPMVFPRPRDPTVIWKAYERLVALHNYQTALLERDLDAARSGHSGQTRNTLAFGRERDDAYKALQQIATDLTTLADQMLVDQDVYLHTHPGLAGFAGRIKHIADTASAAGQPPQIVGRG